MSRFSIFIAQPRGYVHSRMFVEWAGAVAEALRMLGHEVAFAPGDGATIENPRPWPTPRDRKLAMFGNTNVSFGRSIIFAPHFLPDVPLPDDAILVNSEQVPSQIGAPETVSGIVADAWLRGDHLKVLRRHQVWDYSATNIERLGRLGVENVKHCHVGYSPRLTRIERAPDEDIDVLFYGSIQEGSRRHAVLKELHARGLKVVALCGVYGAERDQAIARAKVVLNVHCNEPQIAPAIFEVVRCSYLFANRKCVVTESGGQDPELEQLAASAAVSVPYEKIVDTVSGLADSAAQRRAVAERGFETFSAIDQAEEIRRALTT